MSITFDTEKNINQFVTDIKNKNGVYFVWFFADYCGFCHQMNDEWEKLEKMTNTGNVNILKIEKSQLDLLGFDPHISGYPTIRLYKNNFTPLEYSGEGRTADGFMKFIEQNTTSKKKQKGKLFGKQNKSKKRKNKSKKRKRKTKRKNKY